MEDKLDVIIVGAGLAGSSAAYRLAQEGLQVALIERGQYPGSKNVSGGVLYSQVLHQLIPDFWKEAPVERFITNQVVAFLTEEASFNIDFKTQRFGLPPYNGFSVLRAKFDRWLAEKAEEAGAMLVPGIRVDHLLRDGEQVIGIAAGDEEMLADVVILADGANSPLVQEAGLGVQFSTHQVAVGVKELIGLPRATIDERFHLSGDEGVAYGIVGSATCGIPGGGFLYTNQESVSIGLVLHMDELIQAGLKPGEAFELFLAHPLVAPLIRGGKLLEYGAHLVLEGGLRMMPRISTGGLLVAGDAAGLSVNTGFVVRGMDLAIGSGVVAAEAALEARAHKDFSPAGMGIYDRKLEASIVMRDMHTYDRAPEFMKNRHLYQAYPQMLTTLMTEIYQQDGQPGTHLLPLVLGSIKEARLSWLDLAKDGWKGVTAL